MKGKRRYFNKVPPFTPCPEHWTRKGSGGWKAKVQYESEDAARDWLDQNQKLRPMGYAAYQCPVCQKWHVGRKQDQQKGKDQ